MHALTRLYCRPPGVLEQHAAALNAAATQVVQSKQRLDQAIADRHNEDEFRKFAEAARKSKLHDSST